jgi:hypothetical protein
MAPIMTRANVTIPAAIETAFRKRMGTNYGSHIPNVNDVPIGLLIRFAVLIETGIDPAIAERGLRNLSRGTYKKASEFGGDTGPQT